MNNISKVVLVMMFIVAVFHVCMGIGTGNDFFSILRSFLVPFEKLAELGRAAIKLIGFVI